MMDDLKKLMFRSAEACARKMREDGGQDGLSGERAQAECHLQSENACGIENKEPTSWSEKEHMQTRLLLLV